MSKSEVLVEKVTSSIPFRKIFTTVFIYSAVIAIFVQLLLLPHLVPSLHAGHGLLKGHDWVTFHNRAIDLAQVIRQEGWGAWSLRPRHYIEVGLITPLYYYIAAKPWVVIPFNALFHALSAIVILLILRTFLRLDERRAWAVILPYTLLPTSLLWVTQIHKDGLSFLGSFLFILGLLLSKEAFCARSFSWRKFLRSILVLTLGIIVGWVARPFLLDMFTAVGIALGIYLLLRGVFSPRPSIFSYRLIVPMGLIFLSLVAYKSLKGAHIVEPMPPEVKMVGIDNINLLSEKVPEVKATESKDSFFAGEIKQEELKPIELKEPWTDSWWLPRFIDQRLYTMSQIRLGYSRTPAATNFDADRQFLSAGELIPYLPRLLQIMLFAPSPSFLKESKGAGGSSFFRKIVTIEIYLSYLLFPFLLIQLYLKRKNETLWIFAFSCSLFMFVYAATVVNLGTFHRFRFGFLQLLLAAGIPLLLDIKDQVSQKWTQKAKHIFPLRAKASQ